MSATENKSDAILLGTACRTINPPKGLWLWGYPNAHKRLNTGVALDLCARAAVFGSARTQSPAAAIVVLDTLGITPQIVQRIRQAASKLIPGLPPNAIMVVATHTHSAPSLFVRIYSKEKVEGIPDYIERATAYVDQIIDTTAAALADAWKQRAEVRMRVGRTEVRFGHNRRVIDADGRASNDWQDPEGRHTGFFNPMVRVLVFDDARTNKPRCVLSFYGVHPVTLGGRNFMCSADYPGYFCRGVEAALPGCMAIHVTSGAADINPREALSPDHEKAKPPGDILARAVLEEVPHAHPAAATPIGVHSEVLTLTLAPDDQNYSGRAKDSLDGKTLTAEIQVIRLGDVALISSPGELFSESVVAIENISPFPTTCVVGYGNDLLGYLFTDAALREGGYEVQGPIALQIEQPLLQTSRTALYRARESQSFAK